MRIYLNNIERELRNKLRGFITVDIIGTDLYARIDCHEHFEIITVKQIYKYFLQGYSSKRVSDYIIKVYKDELLKYFFKN